MGQEIERKFLVVGDEWRLLGKPVRIVQGYLSRDKERVVRLRVSDEQGFITVKGISKGAARAEFEYEIPKEDAQQMIRELCLKPLVEKTRYYVRHNELVWHVDEFHAPRAGLVVAEIEIPTEDYAFERPDWVGKEVTGDPAYYNQNMA
jgi:adenylate cyclase